VRHNSQEQRGPLRRLRGEVLHTARRLGHLTTYVNGEGVAKFRVGETSCNAKTDIEDPHIIRSARHEVTGDYAE